ncbi:hypothetical protein IWQ62_002216 [Dispira parvispora]|uniref:Uncharacterized protein n=1 Tax=Dispira parvispora TaxID=1520584 RepID=A0A9W8AX84_9FUNG|nr:hypothetical protein IWQ62_002216 [Dispira parvispora]
MDRLPSYSPKPSLPTVAELPTFLKAVHAKYSAFQPSADPKAKTALQQCLLRNHTRGIVFQGFRTNHLVHKLYTQWSLGATPARLQLTFDGLFPKLEPLPSGSADPVVLDSDNWLHYFGNRQQYGAYLEFFDKEIRRYAGDLSRVVQQYFQQILPGLLGGLTHPWIHVAFALEFDDPLVLSEGLAYACSWYFDRSVVIDVPDSSHTNCTNKQPNESITFADPVDILLAVSKDSTLTLPPGIAPFGRRFEYLVTSAADQTLIDLVHRWELNTTKNLVEVLHRLTLVTVLVYAGRKDYSRLDFYLAHAVTSLFATHILLPYISDPNDRVRMLRLQLYTILAIYVAEGRGILVLEEILGYQPLQLLVDQETPGTVADYLRERALATEDDHVAKVVRALDYFESLYGFHEGLFRNAALKTVDLVVTTDDWIQ